jgi:hypothetical protein
MAIRKCSVTNEKLHIHALIKPCKNLFPSQQKRKKKKKLTLGMHVCMTLNGAVLMLVGPMPYFSIIKQTSSIRTWVYFGGPWNGEY